MRDGTTDKRQGRGKKHHRLATLVVIALLLLGGGFGLGKLTGEEGGDPAQTAAPTQSAAPLPTATPEPPEEQKVVLVTVFENEYIYDNQRLELEKLLDRLSGLDGDTIVQIMDDNASLRAYQDLIDGLEAGAIGYMELP